MAEDTQVGRIKRKEYQTSKVVSVSVIVSCTVIALACIAALTIVLSVFSPMRPGRTRK
jgi:hypothetical protein